MQPGSKDLRICEDGHLDRAVAAALLMEEKGSGPCADWQLSVSRACGGKMAGAEARQSESAMSSGECVVNMLVKCGGCLIDAMPDQVLHALPQRSLRSWSAVTRGYTSAGQGREAVRYYHHMRAAGCVPNEEIMVGVVRACGSVGDLKEGKSVHDDARQLELTSNLFVGTSLIDMYGRCGSIMDARAVFDELCERSVVSWNSMLTAYCRQGEAETALQLYEEMLEQGMSPNDRTLVSCLQACCMLASGVKADEQQVDASEVLVKGKELHAYADKQGYARSNVFVANALMNMYGKHRSSAEAWNVFEGLYERDIVSWNTMLAAYVQLGEAEKALQVYAELQEEGASADARTFVSVLQACGMVGENEEGVCAECEEEEKEVRFLGKGKAVHADARRHGLDCDVFVGSSLISMYSKLGSIADARRVFEGLPCRNMVCWNAMLAGYVAHGEADEAVQLYRQMLEKCVSVSEWTYVSMVQACGICGEREVVEDEVKVRWAALQMGKLIHAAAWRDGYQEHVIVGNTVMSMYGKCGSVEDARVVLDDMARPSVVSWNVMLAAYANGGQGEASLELYRQMQVGEGEGLCVPDARTFVAALQACGVVAEKEALSEVGGEGGCIKWRCRVEGLEVGKGIHGDAWMRGCGQDVFVRNSLVSMYGKCGSLEDARWVIDGMGGGEQCESVVAWSALISAHVEQHEAGEALKVYEEMQEAGVRPDDGALVCALEACGMVGERWRGGEGQWQAAVWKGKAMHGEAASMGYERDVFVSNALMSMYAKCGSLADTRAVFDGWEGQGHDVVAWNVLLGSHVHGEQGQQVQWVVQLYRRMQAEGVSPDEMTCLCMLQACSRMGSLELCREMHATVARGQGQCSGSSKVANTLIHAYGSCGSLADAEAVFLAVREPDVVSWTALMSSYARQGDCAGSVRCLESMVGRGVQPDGVTFVVLLWACAHGGLVERGVEVLESMWREHEVLPQVEHYVCVVDMLGRAGLFSRLDDLVRSMPVQPSLSLWLCLLGACRLHGDVRRGRRAFDAAVQLQPGHGATYMLMWNIYRDAGMAEQAGEVMALRQRAGAWKPAGRSWTEAAQVQPAGARQVHMYSFEVRDASGSVVGEDPEVVVGVEELQAEDQCCSSRSVYGLLEQLAWLAQLA